MTCAEQLDSYAPSDFVVDSIARDCEDVSRGNTCDVDVDGQGITCYVTCLTSFCNNITRRPTQSDIKGAAGTGSDVTATPLTSLVDHVTRKWGDGEDEDESEEETDSHRRQHLDHHGNRHSHDVTVSPSDGARDGDSSEEFNSVKTSDSETERKAADADTSNDNVASNPPITSHGHDGNEQSAGDLYSSQLTGHNGDGRGESDVFVLANSQSDGDFIQTDQSGNAADPTAQHGQHLGISSAGTITSSVLLLLLAVIAQLGL